MNGIQEEILKLKKEKNAIILAHYYVPGDVQALADYVGDSYYLAKIAAGTDAKTVVFCGVGFMGQSVKILNPHKTVLMPDLRADCAMAHMASAEKIAEMRKNYPDLAVVCYINSTAELKCLCDVCVTSSNAVKIVESLPNKNIYFIPDRNLGNYVAAMVPHKNIILNDGCCPIHAALTADTVRAMKKAHPDAAILAHPECTEGVLMLANFIGSTSEILAYAHESELSSFIICTEEGVDYALMRENPDKQFYYPEQRMCCFDMKLNTPEKVLHVLQTGENEVTVDDRVRECAMIPLERMLKLAK